MRLTARFTMDGRLLNACGLIAGRMQRVSSSSLAFVVGGGAATSEPTPEVLERVLTRASCGAERLLEPVGRDEIVDTVGGIEFSLVHPPRSVAPSHPRSFPRCCAVRPADEGMESVESLRASTKNVFVSGSLCCERPPRPSLWPRAGSMQADRSLWPVAPLTAVMRVRWETCDAASVADEGVLLPERVGGHSAVSAWALLSRYLSSRSSLWPVWKLAACSSIWGSASRIPESCSSSAPPLLRATSSTLTSAWRTRCCVIGQPAGGPLAPPGWRPGPGPSRKTASAFWSSRMRDATLNLLTTALPTLSKASVVSAWRLRSPLRVSTVCIWLRAVRTCCATSWS
mmetsp:Transcript_26682/g.75384  ORF Transcript_26682/g.75384 Transcript_26682/m.75384 type:complete len:342 (+) Transcript_26682:196-1221(+)